jgi:hypothetical protein
MDACKTNNIITELTLGRNTHKITELDRFLDNGICVQLVKQQPMKVRFGAQDTMTLSKDDVGRLAQFTQITHERHEYLCHTSKCRVFSLTSEPIKEMFVVVGRVADCESVLKFVKSNSEEDAANQFEAFIRIEHDCDGEDEIFIDYSIPLSNAENNILAI